MANLSKVTKDHEEIRRWAEERGGTPSHVKRTGSEEDVGILRIDFPGYSGEGSLEPITWEEFFEKFDDRNLALLYEEETAGGERSNFNKIVSSETAEEADAEEHKRERTRSRGARGGGQKKTPSTAKRGSAPPVKHSAATSKTASKTGAKKASKTAGKSVAAKSPAKRAPAKKAAKKTGAARTASKKAAAKKSTVKKGAAKKGAAKKSATRKTATKKSASKKVAGRRR